MKKDRFYDIFKKGSKTYFYNSIFFPKEVRGDVFVLYSFVRVADNLVDSIPQKKDAFCDFFDEFCRGWDGEESGDEVMDSFILMAKRKKFSKEWIEAFLHSMELDLTKSSYKDIDEVEDYIYGSAEVVGLMMSRIMEVKEEFYDSARYLGKAMQYINFIRDIKEDLVLGRRYLPTDELIEAGLKNLSFEHVSSKQAKFESFIREQLARYSKWQKEAEKGFPALEKNYRIPVMNASDMYNWTARRIEREPMIVYRKKVKPSKARIVGNLVHKRFVV
jgi:phytoene synthase